MVSVAAFLLAFGSFFMAMGRAYAAPVSQPPEFKPRITYSNVSPTTVAYQGRTVPGYITVTLRTEQPSQGSIRVEPLINEDGQIVGGSSDRAAIVLSNSSFKTEHVVNWSPYDHITKKPLSPGTYVLKADLSDGAGNRVVGSKLGQITVVPEPNPQPLIDSVSANPETIAPKYTENGPVTTIKYYVHRPAEVQAFIRDKNGAGIEYFRGPKTTLSPGLYSFDWNGRDEAGRIVSDGEYEISFKANDLTYNYPFEHSSGASGKLTVKGGDWQIPLWRMQQIVTGVKFDTAEFTPNGDGVGDTVNGAITLAEKARVEVWISNAANASVRKVLEWQDLEPGIHSFTWDGKDFQGQKSHDGLYRIKVNITEKGFSGSFISDTAVNVKDSYQIEVPQPEQKVRVTVPTTVMTVGPHLQQYVAKQGEVFTILDYDQVNSYKYQVLINGSVVGSVSVADVEMIDLDKIPVKMGVVQQATTSHAGPSGTFPLVEKISKGDQVRILRQEGNWYRVLLKSGKQAYVRVSDLDTDNTDLLVRDVKISNKVISPKYGVNEPLTSISFDLARKADVTVWLQNGDTRIDIFNGERESGFVSFDPGRISFDWNGRRPSNGQAVPDGDYKVFILTKDLVTNQSQVWESPAWVITVTGVGQWPLPQSRAKEILPEVRYTPEVLVPGVQGKDKVNIGLVLTEKAEIQVIINNKPEVAVDYPPVRQFEFLTLEPGEHNLTWDGRDLSSNLVPDGTYYVYVFIKDSTGAYTYLIIDKAITVKRQGQTSPGVVHTVAAGDTLWKIAGKYGTTVGAIVKANNLDPKKHLVVGQKLVIPAPAAPGGGGSGGRPAEYVVQPGDSLWKIAQKYGTTVDALVKANNLDPNKYLAVGQKLVIPGTSSNPPAQPVYYTVQKGDSLWKIAQKYGTTVANLARINQIDPNKPIYIGQKLRVA
jgi:LysM repeat protein